MRIGYFVPPTLMAHSGIARRVESTMAAWQRLGHEPVLLVGAAGSGNLLLAHLAGDGRAARAVHTLEGSSRLDHVHVRLFLPTVRWMLLPRDLPVSLEIQAGLWRAESFRDTIRVVLGAATSRGLVARAGMGAFITSEFAQYPEYERIPNKVVIGNGIELTPPAPSPDTARPQVGIVVGIPAEWHGLDRFAELARRHKAFDFVVIAPASTEPFVRSGVAGTPLRPVICHSPEDYEHALASLNLAVGSLALERKGLAEAAPLKVRDYVRAGIPIALAYRDTNLSGLEDPAILEWDGRPGQRFERWAQENSRARLLPSSRSAVSIDSIETRRVAAMTFRAE